MSPLNPTSPIGRWFYPGLYFVLLFFSVVLWLNADDRSYPMFARARSVAPAQIAAQPLELAPARTASRYAVMRSRERLGRRGPNWVVATLRIYVSLLGRECHASTESGFLACLPKKPVSGHLARLGIYRGSDFAAKRGMPRLARRLRELADLSVDDPLNRRIFSEYVNRLRERRELSVAREVVDRAGPLSGAVATLARARIVARSGGLVESRAIYFQAARQTQSRYWLRAIVSALKVDQPELFRSSGPHQRDLLLFASVLPKSDLAYLKRIPAEEIIATTNPSRVEGDAFFLIRTFQTRHLLPLAKKQYTHLSRHTKVLYRILAQLTYDRNHGVFQQIIREFSHARKSHRGIWRLYIRHLGTIGQPERQLGEVIAFLAEHRADYHMYDRLIERLIGPSVGSRRWANDATWKRAFEGIPANPFKGRLLFWFHEYLESRGRTAAAARLRDEFYELAPGSYYAHFVWRIRAARGEDRDFAKAWKDVDSRKDYLRWVSRYGGNMDAVRFLAKQDFREFLDPAAVKLWENMQKPGYELGAEILDLHRMGEYYLAREYYKDRFEGRVSEAEDLARQSYIGRRTGILYLGVYYSRQLARARGVAEDPFSMPGGLLKTLYPRPYLDIAVRRASQYKIDPNMIYALMRQESMFKENAISRSNARGLMQVMPATGRWLAQRLRMRSYDLHKPDTSIHFGAMFFADLLRVNDGDFRWAAIAYNGGPGNLRKWKRRYYRGDLNRFLEHIPAEESRNYCRVTYQNYEHYRATYILHPD